MTIARDRGGYARSMAIELREARAEGYDERLGYVRGQDHVFPDGFVLLRYRKELSADGST